MDHGYSPIDGLVQDIRTQWTQAGVEVESVSGNKVRCRMPSYLQGVQAFTQSLEHYNVAVDLDVSVSAGAANVVFTVFADEDSDAYIEHNQNASPAQGRQGRDWLYIALMILCLAMQIAAFVDWQRVQTFFNGSKSQ